MKSHTGITMTMGKGAVISNSRKQKLNMRSLTGAELVASNDALTGIMWTKRFLQAQGYDVSKTILKQDNTSTPCSSKRMARQAATREQGTSQLDTSLSRTTSTKVSLNWSIARLMPCRLTTCPSHYKGRSSRCSGRTS